MIQKFKKFLLPKKDSSRITWVLEFPKSGITYFLWFLGNYELLLAGSQSQITWFNISAYIQSEGGGYTIPKASLGNRQFVKSHSALRREMISIIVLFRDLDDVMVSYYNFCTQLGYYNRDFNSFVRSRYGIKKWVNYYLSFTDAEVHQKIMIINFNDLFEESEMKEIIHGIFGSLDESYFYECLERCSIENMRLSEDTYRKRNPFNELSFVGKKGKLKKEDLLDKKYFEYKRSFKKQIDLIYSIFNKVN